MSRDPVEIAELARDLEEIYGSKQQQFEDWWRHQENLADLAYTDRTIKEKSNGSK